MRWSSAIPDRLAIARALSFKLEALPAVRREWTSIFGSERLTGALLDRLTHHVHILEMNGQSYRLATSKKAQPRPAQGQSQKTKIQNEGEPVTVI